jgi:hypothetical protein
MITYVLNFSLENGGIWIGMVILCKNEKKAEGGKYSPFDFPDSNLVF